MRLYALIYQDDRFPLAYAGSMVEARTARQQQVDRLGCKKKDIDLREVEIPTNKVGLLAALNDLARLRHGS